MGRPGSPVSRPTIATSKVNSKNAPALSGRDGQTRSYVLSKQVIEKGQIGAGEGSILINLSWHLPSILVDILKQLRRPTFRTLGKPAILFDSPAPSSRAQPGATAARNDICNKASGLFNQMYQQSSF
ncbi:hypothetical protein PGT21_015384 [Puccinia graminis f. sp. tritici]|uniref:Uncharacterized protein n=1 Tax=Puccinia graminis f. sp. tritici TaxID=56615 RepID=A0A5B0N2M0_PUCGR|nr:hypothetical protein PGT21_015384 [Puccinia graminis f. sp. tritici]KAA1087971.1 hypothetical protein PGTUg99_011827 [Puccinia graminis f. sp. tritici]